MTATTGTPLEDRSQVSELTCVYGSWISSCADHGRNGPPSHQSQSPLESPKDAHRSLVGSNDASGTKLTSQSLDQHNREQADLYATTPVHDMSKQKQSSKVMTAAQSLDIDLSKEIFNETMQDVEGKNPMERYLGEKNHRVHVEASPKGFVDVYRSG